MRDHLGENRSLDQYTYDLTALARRGSFPRLEGHEVEVSRLFEILLRRGETHSLRRNRHPVVLHVEGETSQPIVLEAVRRMARGEAPEPLCPLRVIALDYERLRTHQPKEEAGTVSGRTGIFAAHSKDRTAENTPGIMEPGKNQWIEQRLAALFETLRQSQGQIILFVDHLHRLVGRELNSFPVDVAPLLVSALASPEVQLIGACSLEQFEQRVLLPLLYSGRGRKGQRLQ